MPPIASHNPIPLKPADKVVCPNLLRAHAMPLGNGC
jgi:hypothetical protein